MLKIGEAFEGEKHRREPFIRWGESDVRGREGDTATRTRKARWAEAAALEFVYCILHFGR